MAPARCELRGPPGLRERNWEDGGCGGECSEAVSGGFLFLFLFFKISPGPEVMQRSLGVERVVRGETRQREGHGREVLAVRLRVGRATGDSGGDAGLLLETCGGREGGTREPPTGVLLAAEPRAELRAASERLTVRGASPVPRSRGRRPPRSRSLPRPPPSRAPGASVPAGILRLKQPGDINREIWGTRN